MRRATTLVVSLVAAICIVACSNERAGSAEDQATTTPPTTTTTSTTTLSDVELPADRPISVIVPSGAASGEPMPLVLLLHGYRVDGAIQTTYLRMAQAADAAGMLLVAPDGTKNDEGLRFWNATDACCGAASGIDDSAYLLDVIRKVSQEHAVDPERIFVIGHSNGGFMAFRMACDHADLIAAVVSIEGATFEDADDCRPSRPVSTLQVHGTADDTIEYDGDSIVGTAYPSALGTLDRWVALNGCDAEPVEPPPPSRQIEKDLPPATVISHDGCDDGATSELWTQPDGVHIPPFTDDFSAQLLAWLTDHARA